jgi:thiamine-phosphate pyrophosphorylase
MRPRQTIPRQSMIVTDEMTVAAAKRVPRGSGLFVLGLLPAKESRRLRQTARRRGLTAISEGRRTAARVHNIRELRSALLARTPLVLLSPMFPTSSHPAWKPIPRMRAAALARLGGRRLIALGGMDARKYARIRNLGFQGWAGISAFRT